jgi:hypothetical protein
MCYRERSGQARCCQPAHIQRRRREQLQRAAAAHRDAFPGTGQSAAGQVRGVNVLRCFLFSSDHVQHAPRTHCDICSSFVTSLRTLFISLMRCTVFPQGLPAVYAGADHLRRQRRHLIGRAAVRPGVAGRPASHPHTTADAQRGGAHAAGDPSRVGAGAVIILWR